LKTPIPFLLKSNEIVIKAGNSNYIIDNNSIKGKLILTNQRVYFKSKNDENFDKEILHHDIKEIIFFNTKFFIPNGLNIISKSGNDLYFTIKNRKSWMVFLNKLY